MIMASSLTKKDNNMKCDCGFICVIMYIVHILHSPLRNVFWMQFKWENLSFQEGIVGLTS